MFQSRYVQEVYEATEKLNAGETEFLQAVHEVFESLDMVCTKRDDIKKHGILERIVEPERFIHFRVTWVDDKGRVQVNRGYRVQFNSALGPYKGGLRFHPTVTASVIKFLGFEQVFKNSLTTLPMGGGKGGADFDPKGKSDDEVMRFCQSYMSELSHHIGQFTDVPAGDIGVGAREVGYLFGQYKRIKNEFVGVLTGKGLSFGGSLVRTEATGYGLCYYVQEALKVLGKGSIEGRRVAISGSGNAAIFAAEKAQQLGGKVVTMSDSNGYIYDANGIDLELIKYIKLEERGRILDYVKERDAQYCEGERVWGVPVDIALPCATQNELDKDDAELLVKNGVVMVAEGANMPCTREATEVLRESGVIYGPGKASNAGGVATSGLEMSQDSMRLNWGFEEVESRLREIMVNIVHSSLEAAKRYGKPGDLTAGANIAGFEKVVEAMVAQGIAY